MSQRSFLAVLLLLALVAGGGALLLLHGPADEPAAPAAPRAAPSDAAQVVLPTPTDRTGRLAATPGTPASAPLAATGAQPAATGRAVDRAGRALAGATVTTYARDDDPPFHTRRPLELRETTDAAGRFRLLGLPVGSELGLEIAEDSHAPAVREPFSLKAGADTDLGDIVLEDGFTLRGTVFGAENSPLSGATVTLSDVTAQMGRREGGKLRTTTTDTGGNYAFEHLGPRQYSVEASAEGHGTASVVLSLVFGGLPSEWRQDFHLERADSALGGWILGPDERGVPDAPLSLTRQQTGGNAYYLKRGRTAADGRFDFPSLPAGVYQLDLDSPTNYFDRPVDLQAGRTDLTVRAQAALAVHGQLVGDGAVDGFHLSIQPDGRTGAGVLANGPNERDLSGDSFDVGGLRPGSYRFEVRATGYAPTSSSDVIIATAQEGTQVRIDLLRGGTISGRLQPAQAGARVELRESDWDPAGPIEATFPTAPAHGLVAKTGDDGTFRFEQVPPETYVLTARPAGAPPIHVRDVEVHDRQTTDVGTLIVQHGGTLFGNVVGPDGHVRPGVRVSVASTGHQAQTVTDAEGAFRLEALPPGDYDVSATPGSLWEALRYQGSASVTLRPEQELGVELTLVERQQQPH